MAEAYSSYVTEWHGGRTRAYVKGYVESETSKTATVYVRGCAEGDNLTLYGVRTTVYVNGTQVATAADNIFSGGAVTQVASCSGRLTVAKTSSSQSISVSATISGETVNGYGPIAGSAMATASVVVGAKVLEPPSAPTNLVAARNAAANIELSWTNNASNAASTLVERCMKGGGWEEIANLEGALASYSDSPGMGAFKYRVRYSNEDGYSGFSNETGYVANLCPPSAPTLTSPVSGSTVNANAREAVLSWRHNAIDSSPQSAATVWWSRDNQAFESSEVEAESFLTLPISGNETVYWKVATKGAHGDYGPASGVSHFLVRTPPVAVLNVPRTVESLPVPVSWTYEDAMGAQASAVLSVEDEEGAVLFSETLADQKSRPITGADFVPEQARTYVVRLAVTSTTSLSHTTQAAMTVDYEPPPRPGLSVATSAGRAENTVTVFEGPYDEGAPSTASISLYRDGSLLAEGLGTGSSYVDAVPPLDRRVEYTAVAHAESGAAAKRSETVVVRSNGFAFFNFSGRVAKVGMNIAVSDETAAEREYYEVASSKYRKVFYGEHSERTGTIGADVFWAHDALGYGEEAMLSSIEALKEHAGIVHLRLPYSDAFDADVSVSVDRSAETYNVASVSIDWRRVE